MLLVNDNPTEMSSVISLLNGIGMSVEVATSTDEALSKLKAHAFDVVNSRRGNNRAAGIELLQSMRAQGYKQPVIFTVGVYEPDKGVPPFAFGITNRIDELCNLVFDALERSRS